MKIFGIFKRIDELEKSVYDFRKREICNSQKEDFMLNNPPKFNKGDVVDGLEITKVNLKSVDAYHNCCSFGTPTQLDTKILTPICLVKYKKKRLLK